MQLQTTKKEQYFYGFLALAAVLMYIEYRYQPVAIIVDVAHYATDRIGKGSPQATASAEPKMAHLAKRSVSKAPVANASNAAAPLPQMTGQHTVAKGDTCYNVAHRYGSDVDALRSINGLDAQCTIHAGQKLTVAKQ